MDKETFRKQELEKIATEYGTEGGGDDYDPHEHRNIPDGTNFLETLMHVLKASLGTGLLAMPQAFKFAGWLNGFVCTLIISLICIYGIHILINAQYKLCKRLKVSYLSYPVAMRVALLSGPTCFTNMAYASQVIVDTFLIVYQIGTCCAYVIFVAENLKELCDSSLSEPMILELYIACLVVPFALILSIPNMKWLVPFTTVSNLFTFITCGILLYHILSDLPEFNRMVAFGPLREFPLFVGIVLFAVAAMGCITTVEKHMAKPKQFLQPFGIINIAMTIITISYACMGLLGYWRHPDNIKPSITLNLDPDTHQAKVVQGLYTIAIYFSYALNGMVPVDIIWHNYLIYNIQDSKYKWMWEYLIRYLIVILTFSLAISVPLLAEIISLFGALCMSALEIIFPAVIHLCVRWPDDLGPVKWVLITDILLIMCGLVGLCSGTYSSIKEMTYKLSTRHTKIYKGDEFTTNMPTIPNNII